MTQVMSVIPSSAFAGPSQTLNSFIPRSSPLPTRPTLKRSMSPYTPSPNQSTIETKRRKTSPSRAFARLSLSPQPSSSSASLISPPTPLLSNSTAPIRIEDERMRSAYSAYEIGPDRIFVDSLGSEPSSPRDSDLDEPQLRLTCRLPLSRPSVPSLPILDQQQQLVLYRPPVHLTVASQNNLLSNHIPSEPSRGVEDSDVAMELDWRITILYRSISKTFVSSQYRVNMWLRVAFTRTLHLFRLFKRGHHMSLGEKPYQRPWLIPTSTLDLLLVM